MMLLEITPIGGLFYAGAGILVFVGLQKLFKKKQPKRKIEELPRDKWISLLENSQDYGNKLFISSKIIHDPHSTKEELEAVLIHLEPKHLGIFGGDPAEIAKNRLIRIKFKILHKRKIERKKIERNERKKQLYVRRRATINAVKNFFKSKQTKNVEK